MQASRLGSRASATQHNFWTDFTLKTEINIERLNKLVKSQLIPAQRGKAGMTASLKDFEKPVPESTTRKKRYIPQHHRRILCIFPEYSRSFGTFHHAYPLRGN